MATILIKKVLIASEVVVLVASKADNSIRLGLMMCQAIARWVAERANSASAR